MGGDYQTHAGNLGYSMEKIHYLEAQKEPTKVLLKEWCRNGQGTIKQLLDALGEIAREDAAELIKDWIDQKRCNCEKCGHLT